MTTEGREPEAEIFDELLWVEDRGIVESTPAPPVRWRMGLVLLALSVLGTAAITPYSISLLRQAKDSPITPAAVPIIFAASLVIEGAISAVAIAMGIGLGRRAGLGPFLLQGFDDVPNSKGPATNTDEKAGPSRSGAWKAIGLASVMGIGLGVLVIGSSYALEGSIPERETAIVVPSPLEGLLASIGAGIREEV